ncbi:ribonuclease-like [Gopherus flavomarginatus]|uniref:ribonuclease-like n=1 Tax=Gopherus flavomarginatus TaxID=286002 RepID=UPI0021CC468C|nr:ribonuclease-like [Gopherus flavomarginatus]
MGIPPPKQMLTIGIGVWMKVDPVTDAAMALRGPHPLLFLTLILLAAGLAQISECASYRQFVTQHFDNPKTNAANDRLYCNLLMQRRGLTRIFCKRRNTFIHAPAGQLQAICARGGTHVSLNLYDSLESFNVTTCRVLPRSLPGNCRYRAAIGNTKIRVACVKGLPVHLEPTYLP